MAEVEALEERVRELEKTLAMVKGGLLVASALLLGLIGVTNWVQIPTAARKAVDERMPGTVDSLIAKWIESEAQLILENQSERHIEKHFAQALNSNGIESIRISKRLRVPVLVAGTFECDSASDAGSLAFEKHSDDDDFWGDWSDWNLKVCVGEGEEISVSLSNPDFWGEAESKATP